MSDMIKPLTETVRGRVIVASDPDYDAMHDRGPNAVVQCADAAAVKAAYDPNNLFHVNQNIAPAKRR